MTDARFGRFPPQPVIRKQVIHNRTASPLHIQTEVRVEALIYGYVRDDLADGHAAELEDAMCTLASEVGLCFAATFHESTQGDGTAFAELTAELKRAEAHHVVVPSLDHLAGQTIPRDVLIAKLAHDAEAQVLTIET